MKLLNFTIIKLSFCLVIGILLAHYLQLDFFVVLYLTISLIILLGIYWLVLRSKINRSPYFSILAFTCMIGIGIISYNIQDEKLRPQHYTQLNYSEGFNPIIFQIEKRLKPNRYNNKYIVSIKSFNNQEAIGHLLVNIKRDSTLKQFNIDDIFYTSAILQPIEKPLNPHQFDYSKYLELQKVYHQINLNSTTVLKLSDTKSTIYGYADVLRLKINSKLIEAGFKTDVLSIMNALLLGQRQTIDKTIYNNYVNSGTIHILAVSGLHIGLILWILNAVFRPILYLKYGRVIRPFILVSIMWSFAVIAGLSPSVTRAVTMFSVISIAMHLQRPKNTYNTLAISIFIILLFKPSFLFSVGFQLSYIAVISIVSIQPYIYNLWKPRSLITNKLWEIFTVTLAAQIGVAPISLFYFHQFPGLFFISNVVIIPFLGLILGFGMLVIALALLGILPQPIVTIYSFIIDTLNSFIAWIAQFENFLLKDVSFTALQMLTSYFIIIALVQVYKFRNFKWTAISLVSIIGLQAVCFYNKQQTQNRALIIFNKSRYSIIGLKERQKLTVAHNLEKANLNSEYVINNYKVGEAINTLVSDSLQSVYQFKGTTLLTIDSLAIYKGISFRPDYILLRNSPKLNLNRLIDSLKPKKIIADASNYKSYLKRWKATCEHKKIPFHQTNEKGAFIIK